MKKETKKEMLKMLKRLREPLERFGDPFDAGERMLSLYCSPPKDYAAEYMFAKINTEIKKLEQEL